MAGTVSEIPQKLSEKVGNKSDKLKETAPKLEQPKQVAQVLTDNEKLTLDAYKELEGKSVNIYYEV